jgi:hypothetical protein
MSREHAREEKKRKRFDWKTGEGKTSSVPLLLLVLLRNKRAFLLVFFSEEVSSAYYFFIE